MIRSLNLILLLILATVTLSAHEFRYTHNGQTLIYGVMDETDRTVETIYPYSGYNLKNEVIIPATVTDGGIEYTVKSIGERTFSGCLGMTSVTIPNTVTTIKKEAFVGCGLESIVIPDSVISIDERAFSYNGKLKEVWLGNSLESIGVLAFERCDKLLSINIPESVTSIGRSAFIGCENLSEVIYNAVNAKLEFDDANYSSVFSQRIIQTVVIGENVKYIPENAFNSGKIEDLKEVIFNAIDCETSSEIVFSSTLKKVTIGDKVKRIPENVFCACSRLQSLRIPDSVHSIGEYAFYGSGLKEISLGNAVTSIGNNAFEGCENLSSVCIPNSVLSIGERVFARCNSLRDIQLGSSIKTIGAEAFSGCAVLDIVIPNSVTSIGDKAFADCQNMQSVKIGNSVTSIGERLFARCKSLRNIQLGSSIKTIGAEAFTGCAVLDIVIPNSVTSIGDKAFADCRSLQSVKIGNSVTSIGDKAFTGCAVLDIVIPNSVTSIGGNAFADCRRLRSVILGNSVTSIGDKAFMGCTDLSTINMPKSITSIGEDAFSSFVWELKTVNIESPNIWSSVNLGNAQSNPISQAHSFYVSDWEIKNLVLNVGSVPVSDYAFYDADNLSTVRIKGCGVGSNSFADCSNINALCLDVKFLSKLSFGNCSKLKSIYCLTEEPPTAPNDAFSPDTYKNATLYVPIGCASKYENTRSCWFHFSNIVESDFSEIDKIFKADYYEDDSGIENVFSNGVKEEIDLNLPYHVYNLEGVCVSQSISSLKPGIYIVRQGNLAKK